MYAMSVLLKVGEKFNIGAWHAHPGIKLQLSGERGNWPVTKHMCSIFRNLEFDDYHGHSAYYWYSIKKLSQKKAYAFIFSFNTDVLSPFLIDDCISCM